MTRPAWFPTRSDLPGVAIALGIGGLAVACVKALPPSPLLSDVLVALLFGVVVLNTPLARLIGVGVQGGKARPDRWAPGLRFTGKWLLRISIVLMGLKVQTSFFGAMEIVTIFIVAAATIPSTFFVAHVLGAFLRVRRPLVDLLAGGTMICGASAVNAIAPACRAHREEQGVAIAVVFLFSVTAMLSFRTIAFAIGLEPSFAGLWSGLAVNDLASAIAVGAQMGESGGVMAAASKSARIVMLAPVLVAIALARRKPAGVRTLAEGEAPAPSSLRKSIVDALPGFIVGYLLLAVVRTAGDRLAHDADGWRALLAANRFVVDVLMSAVAAGIGLHLSVRAVLASSLRAVVVGAGASIWMASLSVTMIAIIARGSPPLAIALGGSALVAAFLAHRAFGSDAARARAVARRFDAGGSVTIEEATVLLGGREKLGKELDDGFLRTVLARLAPSLGELGPARTSPLHHGEGCRWLTYWEGTSGWALVVVVRDPGAVTPIHAHPHRLLGKAVEGALEELRFRAVAERDGHGLEIELVSRETVGGGAIVEADGLSSLHVVRAVSTTPAVDVQLRGPEVGRPGRLLRPCEPVELRDLAVGQRIVAVEEVDRRPGQQGEGAAAGRPPLEAA